MDKLSYDVFYNKGFFLQAFGIYGRGCLSNTTKLGLLNYPIFHLVEPNKYSQQSPNIQSSQGAYPVLQYGLVAGKKYLISLYLVLITKAITTGHPYSV